MNAVVELQSARLGGLSVGVADLGLVKGYVCVAHNDHGLEYVERKDVHEAIAKCWREHRRENDPWPEPNMLYCHDAPGELALLIEQFKGRP